MLVLVVQVLIGFDYKAVFEAKFVELPVLLQYLKLFSLAAQLITLMLLLAIPSYHRIAEQGENSAHFCRVIKRLMAIALFPFAFSFGAEFAILGRRFQSRFVGVHILRPDRRASRAQVVSPGFETLGERRVEQRSRSEIEVDADQPTQA